MLAIIVNRKFDASISPGRFVTLNVQNLHAFKTYKITWNVRNDLARFKYFYASIGETKVPVITTWQF